MPLTAVFATSSIIPLPFGCNVRFALELEVEIVPLAMLMLPILAEASVPAPMPPVYLAPLMKILLPVTPVVIAVGQLIPIKFKTPL